MNGPQRRSSPADGTARAPGTGVRAVLRGSAVRAVDGGFVAGADALVFGVLVFVVGTLLVVSAWTAVDATMAAGAAAREAVRRVVEAPAGEPVAAAVAAATVAAHATLAGHGRTTTDATVTIDAAGGPDGTPVRCSRVAASVTVRIPAVWLPWLGGVGGWSVTGRHSEIVDPLRSGLSGEARCVWR